MPGTVSSSSSSSSWQLIVYCQIPLMFSNWDHSHSCAKGGLSLGSMEGAFWFSNSRSSFASNHVLFHSFIFFLCDFENLSMLSMVYTILQIISSIYNLCLVQFLLLLLLGN